KSFDSQRTRQIGDVFIISSWLSSSSSTKPLPPHVGHRRSSSVPFSTTLSPLQVWTGFHVRRMHMLPHPSNGRAAMGGMMQMAGLFAGASPLYPRKRTFALHQHMSALVEKVDIATTFVTISVLRQNVWRRMMMRYAPFISALGD